MFNYSLHTFDYLCVDYLYVCDYNLLFFRRLFFSAKNLVYMYIHICVMYIYMYIL